MRGVGKTLAFGDWTCQKRSVLCGRGGDTQGRHSREERGFSLRGRWTERGVHHPAVISSPVTPSPPASALEGASLPPPPHLHDPQARASCTSPHPCLLGVYPLQKGGDPGPVSAADLGTRGESGVPTDGHGDRGPRSLSAPAEVLTPAESLNSVLRPWHPADPPPAPRSPLQELRRHRWPS